MVISRLMPFTLLILLATLALAACSPPTPTPTPEPLSSDNIRERIVQSLEREGNVAQFEIAFSEEEGQQPVHLGSGWLDMAQQRVRFEEDGGSIVVVADGHQFILHPGGASASLRESEIGTLSNATGTDLPPGIDNAALTGLYPLVVPLALPGIWVATGEGDWNGEPSSVWEVEHEFGESGDVLSVVHVDPETALPMGHILRLSGDSRSARSDNKITYSFTFVDSGDLPDGTFATQDMREELLGYGAHEGEGPDYPLVWLGLEVEPGAGLPTLTLGESRVWVGGDVPRTEFTYHVANRIPYPTDAQFGLVTLGVRDTVPWEGGAREEVTVLGKPALFTIESFTRTNATVWVDDIIIDLEAAGIIDPIAADRYEGGIAPQAHLRPKCV